MRAASFTIYNEQILELVASRREGESYRGFEAWLIGTIKGHRTILDHFLTTQLLERSISYAQAGDLVWRDAQRGKFSRLRVGLHPPIPLIIRPATQVCYQSGPFFHWEPSDGRLDLLHRAHG